MTWQFRKSFKLFPGVRLNLTSRGISTTIGASPFSVNIGPRGTFTNVGIPGTGLHSRSRIGPPSGPGPSPGTSPGEPSVPVRPSAPPLTPSEEEIKSAGTQALTSEGLHAFRELIASAWGEREDIGRTLVAATSDLERVKEQHRWWDSGFLFKKLRPVRFVQIAADLATAEARVVELKEQQGLATIATEIDLPRQVIEAYARLCDDFHGMAGAERVWDTLTRQAVDRVRERTTASTVITRAPVRFQLGQTDLIASKWQVPHLENANGGDLFVYPGFVLYRVSNEAFAVIDFGEVELTTGTTRFIESERVPADADVVDKSWLKANKDGSPDRRFSANYQIPVARYGTLQLSSATGLREEFMVSRADTVEPFARSWAALRTLMAPQNKAG